MTAQKYIPSLLLAGLLGASVVHADGNHGHKHDKADAGAIAATVNDSPIYQMATDRVAEQIAAQGQPANKQQILDELINLEVLTQNAEELGLDEQPEVATALHLQYTQTMANAYLAAISKDIEISDDDIRAEYEKQIAAIKADEYKASHILLDSEADAIAVIDALNSGGDFAALAREKSTGPTSATGGDLGWFQPENMVPEFADAVAKLEIGDITAAPVQTQFGWHVIQLADKREAAKPDYSPAVKAGIESTLMREALAAHVDELRQKANIEIK